MPKEDTIELVETNTDELTLTELKSLLELSKQAEENLLNANKELKIQAENLAHAVDSTTKNAERAIRVMNAYNMDRLNAVFNIMNSVQVLFKSPDFTQED